ncbi:four-carbon acid sugar kinase family protein [Virgibacillus oceani]
MKIAIIADDLTGACDTGAQLVNYDIKVSVAIQNQNRFNADAIIYNTDSRSMEEKEAYLKVKEVCQEIKNEQFDIIYKKIDSTMRGNIGSELNALYDEFSPDFVFITPAHPNNGRVVRNGVHYLNGIELSETEVSKDPKTPVYEANISKMIHRASGKQVKHISYEKLRKGDEFLLNLLANWKKQGINYITIDATVEEDLKRILNILDEKYSIVLCGSAGLINYLPEKYGYKMMKGKNELSVSNSPALFVIGSISRTGRMQLNHLINNTDVVRVEMDAVEIIKGGAAKEHELKRIFSVIKLALKKNNSVALCSSSNVESTKAIGLEKGISAIEISNEISNELGDLTIEVIKENNIKNLFLTGGDTAQQVFVKLGIESYRLVGQLELGVPIGKANNSSLLNTITKAGNFGTIEVMTKAFHFFNNQRKKIRN